MKEANTILNEIKAIKQSLLAIERNGAAIGGWLPKKAVMRYFDYATKEINKALVSLLERDTIFIP